MKSINKLVEIALSQVGIREEGGNNLGKQIAIYQQATWLKPGAWPWCAAFVCWCIREWLNNEAVKNEMKLTNEQIKTWRPRTAGAFDFLNWAKTNNLKTYDENSLAKAGDIVVFDFSHIGIVIQDQKDINSHIVTIEGNTNGKGDRDSTSGDGVWQKTRDKKLTLKYIRLYDK